MAKNSLRKPSKRDGLYNRGGMWHARIIQADGTRTFRSTGLPAKETLRRDASSVREKLLFVENRKRHGLVDEAVETAKAPLLGLVSDFQVHLEAQGSTEVYRTRLMKRLWWVLRGIGASRLPDITTTSVEALLNELVRSGMPDRCLTSAELAAESGFDRRRRLEPKSRKTRDDYLDAVKEFCKWLHEDGKLSRNPLAKVKHVRSEATTTLRRRAMTEDELTRLLRAAATRELSALLARSPNAAESKRLEKSLRGQCRAVAFLFSASIGVRISALCNLKWGDLDLVDKQTVRLEARYAKNRRSASPPLADFLVTEFLQLKAALESGLSKVMSPSDRVFALLPKPKNVLRLFLRDLDHAGIPRETDEGCLDVHGLRTTAATRIMESGALATDAAEILAVGAGVMKKHYQKKSESRLKRVIEQVPAPGCLPSKVVSLG